MHDSVSKLSWSREKKSGLVKEEFEYILQMFSFISFFKEIFVFDDKFLNETLNKIKEKKTNINFENNLLIEDLQVAICILYKEGLDFVFPHRSLQEYFASSYIVNLDEKNKIIIYKKILQQLLNEESFNIFSLDNFYSLLVEQDHIDIKKYLVVNYYNELLSNIKNGLYDNEKDSKLIGALINFHLTLRRTSEYNNEIFDKLDTYLSNTREIRKKNINLTNKNIKLTIAENDFLKKEYEILLKELKSNIPKVIKDLKIIIENETKSDLGIIELI